MSQTPHRWQRPFQTGLSLLGISAVLLTCGCTSFWRRGDSEESNEQLERLLNVPEPPEFIREAISPKGMNLVRVDGVALVNALVGTGGPPEPSPLRDSLLDEMRRHEVDQPNHVLESNETALVEVRGLIPPGAKKGDPIDLVVSTPPRSNVSDLHGGWLMQSRMRHQQLIQRSVRSSDVLAMGRGPVLTKADHQPGRDASLRLKGVILAGGRVMKSRDLGLLLRPRYQHVKMAAAIAAAINRRFFFFDGTTRRGIATPLEDDYIELAVHPRYQNNVPRLIEVIRAMTVQPESAETQGRLVELMQKMQDPTTARDAALQLEGLGESAVPTLIEAAKSENPELRFYAGEALAYLDRSEGIEPLEKSILDNPAFRHPALLALEGMRDTGASDALLRLINQPSLETRYGAFCALRRKPNAASMLSGDEVDGKFRVFQVASNAEPTVAISLRETPEIVLFGQMPQLNFTSHLFGPGGLMIKPDLERPGQLKINRFLPGEETRVAQVAPTVNGLIHGIAQVGGGYGDVIAVLRAAKEENFLLSQLAADPLPKTQRTYYREPVADADELADATP